MGFIKLIIGLPLFVLLLFFAIVNNDFVTLKIWPTDVEIITSLSVLIFVLFVLGYVVGRFFAWLSYAKIRSSLRAHKKQNKKLSKEQEKLTKEVEGLQDNIQEMKAVSSNKNEKNWKDKFKHFFSKK